MNWYKISQTDPKLKAIRDFYKNKYPGIDLDVWDSANGYVEIASIRLPKELRGQGIGSEIIQKIQEYARSVNKPITLSPQPEKGKKKALDNFYRNLGFIHNKGRNKDFSLSSPFGATMYWRPK